MPNSNTFKLMFWVMTGICFFGLMFIGTSVIANDKLSRGRDDLLDECIHALQVEIVQRLTRIETNQERICNDRQTPRKSLSND